MNIKSLTKYALVFLFGAIAATATSSYAAEKIEQVKAFISSDISIVFNGKNVKLDNPILNYNGRAYLPIRDFEKLDMKIDWNETTKQIGVETSNTGDVNQTSENNNQNQNNENSAIYTEILYEWNNIYESMERPNAIISSVINDQFVITYNEEKYISVKNVDFYYDKSEDKSYYTNSFLSKFISQERLNGLKKYSLSLDNQITQISQ